MTTLMNTDTPTSIQTSVILFASTGICRAYTRLLGDCASP